MKIRESKIRGPNVNMGIKILLISLNTDLDHIKADISRSEDYGWFHNHSISAYDVNLSNVEIATLHLEDKRFFSHKGFDYRSIFRAIRRLVSRGKINGISTIDQQAVRISLGRYERTFSRKIREISLAIFLGMHVSKKSIFNYYLRNAYLGYKIEGCEVAANRIFQMRARNLNREQAAFIASLFPLPFPKSVWVAYSGSMIYPEKDPEKILDIAGEIAPRWASRVRYRMSIAMKSYDLSPSSR